jgi:hypothetical protein
MTGSTYIKQAVIAALCEHPDLEKYRARAFEGDSLSAMADALAGKSVALTKRDFFTPDEKGAYLIDTPGFWKNFARIRDMLAQGNERFSLDDFTFVLQASPERTLLQNAVEHNGLGAIFSEEIWRGRYEEMERLWHKVPVPARRAHANNDGAMPLALKRALFRAEGREMPEDRLARACLTVADVQAAFRERGDYESLNRRLSAAGDYLRKEYLLQVDYVGDTCFAAQNAWTRYPEIAKTLAAHGEQLEVVDFIRQIGNANNILARAAHHRALDSVFAPEHWVNRLGDMLSLWNHVLPAWKVSPLTRGDFDVAYAEAESRTFAPVLDFAALHGKQDLLQPLNAAADEKPVIGLGLKSFWDKAAAVLPVLAKKGEPVLLKDLRRTSGELDNSCLISAAKFGGFRHVVDIVRASGEPLLLEDFLSRDSHDNTLLSILAERKELPLVFSPDLWAGRVGDMRTLWAQVRHADRGQIDMAEVEIATKQATLRKLNKPGLKIKPK